jgi:hypothetical protein
MLEIYRNTFQNMAIFTGAKYTLICILRANIPELQGFSKGFILQEEVGILVPREVQSGASEARRFRGTMASHQTKGTS